MKKIVFAFCLSLAVVSLNSEAAPQKRRPTVEGRTASTSTTRSVESLTRKIRKELVTIPYFTVFDWLEGNVEPDGTVYLRGQVTRPTIKSDAERRVDRLTGVEKVVNEIEVLPLSANDDRIRRAVFRTLFAGGSPLFRYGRGANPSIHIIVNNGRVTLKGVVANQGDSDLANIRVNGVEGVFEVKNELQIETSGRR